MSFSKHISVFNIANILSLIRIFLAIPLAYSVNKIRFESSINDIYIFLIICFLIALTDMLDGYAARAFSVVTNLGKTLDPIADKVCVFVLFIFLTINFPNYFLFYFILLFFRDLIITISTIYFAKNNKYFSANNFGKWFLFFISITMILFIVTIPDILMLKSLIMLRNSFYFLSLLFFTLSSVQYFQNIAFNLRK